MWTANRAMWIVFLLGILLLGGCGPRVGDEPVTRFIEEDPQELFDGQAFIGDQVWSFEGPEIQSWKLVDLREQESATGCFTVEEPAGPGRLDRDVKLDTRWIQAIRLDLEGQPQGPLRFFWAREGEPFLPERVIKLDASLLRDGAMWFDVGSNPNWSGIVRRVAIDPGARPRSPVCLRSLATLGYQIDAERLSAMAQTPWKVELDHEVRNAYFAPPGYPIERRVYVQPGSRLYFGYALARPSASPIRFTVEARSDRGEPKVIFEAQRSSEAEGPASWQDAEVDLGDYAGEQVVLTLKTSVSEPLSKDESILERGLPFWAHPEVRSPSRQTANPNVLLIVIDTLRADHMSLYGYSRPTTPRLEAWAKSSAVSFQNAIAQAPWTLPSHASLFTGQDALRHGVNYEAVSTEHVLVAERFRDAGYTTYASTAGGYVDPAFGFAQGFDVFRLRQDSPQARKDLANELVQGVDEVIAWLKRTPRHRPFFLFFHTYETHVPFWPRMPFFEEFGGDPAEIGDGYVSMGNLQLSPKEAFRLRRDFLLVRHGELVQKTELSPAEEELLLRLYDSGIAFTDYHLDRLLTALRELRLDQNTIVVVTSDHGESLGERDLIGHGYLRDDNLRVPLLVALPGGKHAGEVIEDQVRSIDIVPTLLELTGITAAAEEFDGTSLLPAIEGRPLPPSSQAAWSYAGSTNWGLSLRLSNRIKYIYSNTVWPPESGREQLFLLSEDPLETVDESKSYSQLPALRDRMRTEIMENTNGLAVRFSNRQDLSLRGSIAGAMVRSSGVTSPDLPCRCIAWRGLTEMSFEVPPHESYTLFFENAPRGKLSVRFQPPPGSEAAPAELAVTAEKLDTPRGLYLREGSWRETGEADTPPKDLTGVAVYLTGSQAASGAKIDEDLLERLRALGYVP